MANLLSSDSVEASFPEFESEKYYAVWQHPEGRYAYSVHENLEGWLIALNSQGVGEAYLLSDARMNGRSPSEYRLDELTLPDAFACARAQLVPFRSSHGHEVLRVLGVVLILASSEGSSIRHSPL